MQGWLEVGPFGSLDAEFRAKARRWEAAQEEMHEEEQRTMDEGEEAGADPAGDLTAT